MQGRTGTPERSGAKRLRAIGLIQMSLVEDTYAEWFIEREKAGATDFSAQKARQRANSHYWQKLGCIQVGNFCPRRNSVIHSGVTAGWTQEPLELGCAQK